MSFGLKEAATEESLVPTVDTLRNLFLRLPTEMLNFFQQWPEAR